MLALSSCSDGNLPRREAVKYKYRYPSLATEPKGNNSLSITNTKPK